MVIFHSYVQLPEGRQNQAVTSDAKSMGPNDLEARNHAEAENGTMAIAEWIPI